MSRDATANLAYDVHGDQLFEGDVVRNVDKPSDVYTVAGIGYGNFIRVYNGAALISASRVELVMRMKR